MTAPTASSRWLFGPALDLALGCGVGYAAIVVLMLAVGTQAHSTLFLALTPLISIFTGTPHYGATLLRVYEQRSERQAYAFFAVYVTIVLWALFTIGLYSVWLGSFIITLYLSWSPWHYSGQNYGIALLFLRRRGVGVTPSLKKLLYASFILSFALTLLAVHGSASDGAEYAPVQPYQGGSFTLLRLGIPAPYWQILFAGCALAYLGTIAAAVAVLKRRASWTDIAPTLILIATQALWFSVPPAARQLGLLGPDALLSSNLAAYAFIWIATGHSVQYLWVTTYYAVRDEPVAGRVRYLVKALLAGSFIWGVPGLIYGLSVEGSAWGGVARDLDVFLVVAAVVNLHHFILDGAVWKLRDSRVARVLIRREEPAPDAPIVPEGGGRRWLAPVVYTLGALLTAQVLGSLWQKEVVLRPALRRGDWSEARSALERLRWIRADSASDYLLTGRAAMKRGEIGLAQEALLRSVAKKPAPPPLVALGQLANQQGRPDDGTRAFEQALELQPDHPTALYMLGSARLRAGRTDEAVSLLARAAALLPNDPAVQAAFRSAERAAE